MKGDGAEGHRFDELTIALGGHRRTVLRSLLGGLGVALVGRAAVEAGPPTCQDPGEVCKRSADCCATKCKKRKDKQSGRCNGCGGGAPYCEGTCCQPGDNCVGGDCCTPTTCAALGQVCGTFPDGCGGTLQCTCADGHECVDGGCFEITGIGQTNCNAGCTTGFGNVDGSGNFLCGAQQGGTSCTDNSGCPDGQACTTCCGAGFCIAPC
jgi:hypothetical protein